MKRRSGPPADPSDRSDQAAPEGHRACPAPRGQGPGATSISLAIPEDKSTPIVGRLAGVLIEAVCNSGGSTLELTSAAGGHTVDLYGTYSFGGSVSTVSVHEETGYAIESASA